MDKQDKEFFGFMFGILGLMAALAAVIWIFTQIGK